MDDQEVAERVEVNAHPMPDAVIVQQGKLLDFIDGLHERARMLEQRVGEAAEMLISEFIDGNVTMKASDLLPIKSTFTDVERAPKRHAE